MNGVDGRVHMSDMIGPGDFAVEPEKTDNFRDPRGVWGDGTTVYVVQPTSATVISYRVSDYRRTGSFNVHGDGNQPKVHGACAHGSVMWVADTKDDKLYAYNLPGGARNSGKDITLDSANGLPRGLHCSDAHIWVADGSEHIYAYNHSTKARDTGKEFTTATLHGAGNDSAKGIWSDGTTMWVVDDKDRKVYAYNMSDKAYNSALDIARLRATQDMGRWGWSDSTDTDQDTLNANPVPWGIWSDDDYMWISDENHNAVYWNENPTASKNTRLQSLTVKHGAAVIAMTPGFDPGKLAYTLEFDNDQDMATIDARSLRDRALLEYLDGSGRALTDADTNLSGSRSG